MAADIGISATRFTEWLHADESAALAPEPVHESFVDLLGAFASDSTEDAEEGMAAASAGGLEEGCADMPDADAQIWERELLQEQRLEPLVCNLKLYNI